MNFRSFSQKGSDTDYIMRFNRKNEWEILCKVLLSLLFSLSRKKLFPWVSIQKGAFNEEIGYWEEFM